jgi:zinc protease
VDSTSLHRKELLMMPTRRSFVAVWILVALVSVLAASCTPPSGAAGVERFAYRQTTLDNGLTVVTLEDFSCPIVAVQVWYHVGSKDESPIRQGFAHMFEHMMFRGTDRLGPTGHFDLIRRVGGSCNAYTSTDETVYHEVVPASELPLALWLEAERMALLKIDQESFDTERKVVEEERRVGLNSPYGTLYEKALAEGFKVHPYRWSTIGRIAHLRAASTDELRAFWQRYYVPNNATLVIAGAVSHDEALKQARTYLGWIPRRADPPRVTVKEPQPTARREVTIAEQNAPAPLVAVAFRTVPAGHPDETALDMLAAVLGSGRSSRLHRELVQDTQLAVGTSAISMTAEDDGVFGVGAALPPVGGDVDLVLRKLNAQLARFRDENVSDAELLKVRNGFVSSLVTQNLSVRRKASALGNAAVILGDTEEVNRQLAKVRAVTVDDLRRVAQQYLVDDKALVLRVPRSLLGAVGIGQKKDDGTEDGAADLVGAAPIVVPPAPPPPARPADFPAAAPLAGPLKERPVYEHSRATLPNGLQVIVVPNHEVPYVTVQLGLLGGSWTETKNGAASMAMDLLDLGTAKHTEAQLAEEAALWAINLWTSGDTDTSGAGVGCVTEHLDRAMTLLAEVVRTPTFPEDEFVKYRKRVRDNLVTSEADADYLVGREFDRQLYGQHPYARSSTGEVADVDALTVADLRQWYQANVRPDMAVLIFAGDVTAQRAEQLAREHFGDWTATGQKPSATLPAPPAAQPTRIVIVDRPGSLQSEIRVGQLGITRTHPDYFTGLVVNGYFGGFSGRLNTTVRVTKGLTYGIGGSYSASRFLGAFSIGTFTKNESTADAVRAILDEVRRLKAEPPTADELAKTKTWHLGSFPAQHETPQQISGDFWLIESQGLPADYIDRLYAAVQRTSAEDCLRLTRATLDPDRMLIVICGDAAKIKDSLEKIAPVTVVQPDPIPAAPGQAKAPASKQ